MTDFNPCAYRALQRSDAPLHGHTMHHTEGKKFNKFTATGHCHPQWTWFNEIGQWLMDVETAANLTNESQAKLANAKSGGLTHTLITEAIKSEKTWDVIKDLLKLKLCNTNIHTNTSDFMDIQ